MYIRKVGRRITEVCHKYRHSCIIFLTIYNKIVRCDYSYKIYILKNYHVLIRVSAASTGPSTANDVEMNSAPPANTTELNTRASNHAVAAEPKTSIKPSANTNTQSIQSMTEESANPCVLCMTEERALACIPCGHLATCVPCGHSLKLCPMCRQKIDAFVRVYI